MERQYQEDQFIHRRKEEDQRTSKKELLIGY